MELCGSEGLHERRERNRNEARRREERGERGSEGDEERRGEEVEPAGPVEVFVTTYVRLTS